MRIRISLVFVVLGMGNSVAQKSLDDLLTQYNTRSVSYISVEALRAQQVKEGVILLDSREKDEYDVSHIATARWVDFSNFNENEINAQLPDKDAPIVVYCSLGIRSEEIGEKLKKAGYTRVKNLYGGIFEWKNKGYPVIDSIANTTENIHIYAPMWGKWLEKGVPVH